MIVIVAFIVTSDPRLMKKGQNKLIGFLLGVVNGIVLIALLLPKLSSWLVTTTGEQATASSLDVIVAFVSGLWNLFYQTLQNILQRIGPISPSGWLLIITVLLVLIAWPMRAASKKK
jgi:predicted ABC-type sugar transport system permease subunit